MLKIIDTLPIAVYSKTNEWQKKCRFAQFRFLVSERGGITGTPHSRPILLVLCLLIFARTATSHSNCVVRIMKECGKEGCCALLSFKPMITSWCVSAPEYYQHSLRHLELSCFVKTIHLPLLSACSPSHSPSRFQHRKRKNGSGLLLVTLDPFPRLFHLSVASG